MIYQIARALCRAFFKIVYRWRIIGLENIPQTGPVILCSNHLSNLDPPLVGSPLNRRISFMAKEELFRNRALGKLISILGAFPVKRGGADRQAIITSLNILKDGKILGIFPEGTRSKTGEIGEAYSGAALFALKTGSPVVPTAIIGPYRIFKPVTVVYGEPIVFKAEGKIDQKSSENAMKEIMSRIQELKKRYENK